MGGRPIGPRSSSNEGMHGTKERTWELKRGSNRGGSARTKKKTGRKRERKGRGYTDGRTHQEGRAKIMWGIARGVVTLPQKGNELEEKKPRSDRS